MKILILADKIFSSGGAGVIAWIHAETLKNHGHEVIIITTSENKEEEGKKNEKGVLIYTIYSKYHSRFRAYLSLCNFFIIARVKKILREQKPDIVHAHNIHYHLSYCSLKIAKLYAKGVFITIHDSMPFHYSKFFPKYPYETVVKSYKVSLLRQLKDFRFRFNPFKNILIRHYLKAPDKIFAVSNALKQALLDNGISNVEVVHNGIDVKKWQIDSKSMEEFKNRYNLFDKKVIMFCGRLSRAKGGEVLMRIMPDIIGQMSNAVLLIVGEKDGMGEIGNSNSLLFTGKMPHNDIIKAYKASNVLVVPSLCFDWFPTVNLEAMASEVPVIATCFGGSKEAVLDGTTGSIINPYHERELAHGIVDILKNNEKARVFGQAGFQRVSKEFNLEKFTEKILFWYNKFL